jgi:hypothetical protein
VFVAVVTNLYFSPAVMPPLARVTVKRSPASEELEMLE